MDNATYPDWALDPANILYLCYNLGFTARAFWENTTMQEVMLMMGEFYTKNENASVPDVAQFLGTSEGDVQALYDEYYNETYTRTSVLGAASVINDLTVSLASPDPVASSLLPVLVVLSILCGIVVALRFYYRTRVATILAADWCMLMGYLLTVVLSILSIMTLQTDPHSCVQWESTYRVFINGQIYLEIVDIVFPVCLFFVKASYLIFYYRLTTWRPFRWSVIGTFVFVLLATIAASLCQLIWQFPVDWWYHLTDTQNTVTPINIDLASLVNGCINVLTDVVIWVLPLPLVWKLGVNGKEKRMAIVTFGFGIIASVVGIVRLPFAYNLSFSNGTISHGAIMLMLPPLEVYIAVMAGSLPIVRAMAMRHLSKRGVTGESYEGVSKGSQPSKQYTELGDLDTVTKVQTETKIAARELV